MIIIKIFLLVMLIGSLLGKMQEPLHHEAIIKSRFMYILPTLIKIILAIIIVVK